MVDAIQIYFRDRKVIDLLRQELPEQVYHVSAGTGSAEHITGCDRHLFFTLYPASAGIKVNGSVHKFAHGNNADCFTFTEIKQAVKVVITCYHVPDGARIQRIEIGVNLPFTCPEVVIDAAMLFNGRVGERYYRKDYYAIEWRHITQADGRERVNYVAKLYKKAEHELRYELHIEDSRTIHRTGLKVIADLRDEKKLLHALHYLYDSLEKLFFVPADFKNKLPLPLHERWGQYRADSFWRQFVGRRECKDLKMRLKNAIRRSVREYDLVDWLAHMKARFVDMAAKIAGIAGQEFATFSPLGLQCESVADPGGESDRHPEREDDSNNSLVPASNAVRNALKDRGNTIQNGCNKVYIRAPPSRHIATYNYRYAGTCWIAVLDAEYFGFAVGHWTASW